MLCAAVTPGGGCVVRAREDRRGDMEPVTARSSLELSVVTKARSD